MHLAEEARYQEGVFSRQQALGSGMSAQQVRRRLLTGSWTKVANNVYADSGLKMTTAAKATALLLTSQGIQLESLPLCNNVEFVHTVKITATMVVTINNCRTETCQGGAASDSPTGRANRVRFHTHNRASKVATWIQNRPVKADTISMNGSDLYIPPLSSAISNPAIKGTIHATRLARRQFVAQTHSTLRLPNISPK